MTTQDTTTETKTIHQLIFNCESREDRKKLLKSLSKSAKKIVEMTEDGTVNSVLIDWYKNEEHNEFHSFWGWRKKGFKVKKGAKSFFVWSKPQTAKRDQPKEGEDEEFEFFGLAYLFSNSQVEPLKKESND